MTKSEATSLINTYGKSWVAQDPDLIVSIFTAEVTCDDPCEPLNVGREAVRSYWQKKVVGEQSDISFDLKNVWVDGDNVIAEWHAEFTDTKRNLRIKMDEVAIFGVRGDKFGSIREYYKTTKTSL